MPEAVTTIGKGAFEACDGLRYVEIQSPSDACSIGSFAFAGCDRLERVRLSERAFFYNAFPRQAKPALFDVDAPERARMVAAEEAQLHRGGWAQSEIVDTLPYGTRVQLIRVLGQTRGGTGEYGLRLDPLRSAWGYVRVEGSETRGYMNLRLTASCSDEVEMNHARRIHERQLERERAADSRPEGEQGAGHPGAKGKRKK